MIRYLYLVGKDRCDKSISNPVFFITTLMLITTLPYIFFFRDKQLFSLLDSILSLECPVLSFFGVRLK